MPDTTKANAEHAELERLCTLFPSIADIVRILEVDPSTFHRWRRDPTKPLPRRARAAIQILRTELSKRSSAPLVNLRIAHHATEMAASAFLTYATREKESEAPPLGRYRAQGECLNTENGSHSLERLAKGEADIAIAHVGVLSDAHRELGCRQLCLVSSAYPAAIASRKIGMFSEFLKMRFGCPNPIIAELLVDWLRRSGRPVSDARSAVEQCDDEKQAAELFNEGKIQCIVAWRKWIDTVRTEIRVMRVNVEGKILPPMQFAAFANLEHTDPVGVDAFLLALQDVTNDFDDFLEAASRNEFRRCLGLGKSQVVESIRDREARFALADLDAQTILQFRRHEALRFWSSDKTKG